MRLPRTVIFRVDGQEVKGAEAFGTVGNRHFFRIKGEESLLLFPVSRTVSLAEAEAKSWKMSYKFQVKSHRSVGPETEVEIEIVGDVIREFKEGGEQ